jgi:hypothetical protein
LAYARAAIAKQREKHPGGAPSAQV